MYNADLKRQGCGYEIIFSGSDFSGSGSDLICLQGSKTKVFKQNFIINFNDKKEIFKVYLFVNFFVLTVKFSVTRGVSADFMLF